MFLKCHFNEFWYWRSSAELRFINSSVRSVGNVIDLSVYTYERDFSVFNSCLLSFL
jgi:hypothetical protein